MYTHNILTNFEGLCLSDITVGAILKALGITKLMPVQFPRLSYCHPTPVRKNRNLKFLGFCSFIINTFSAVLWAGHRGTFSEDM